ncbi:MAG: haloacid dehalogenase-like hydrolase [Pseudomonadales bacterium]|nr:haloacid dehalogenase-like hydrolase [Pseudomonadales bacterium]
MFFKRYHGQIRLLFLLLFIPISSPSLAKNNVPLPSWAEGESRQSLIDFVQAVTTEGKDFVPVAQRIATFDNDGTLWAEQPIYFPLLFVFNVIQEQAAQHPEWNTTEPYQSILAGDYKKVLAGGHEALFALLIKTSTGMNQKTFRKQVTHWIENYRHPTTHRKLTNMAYQPMLELLDYLRANQFKVYIVSGGPVDLMRPWTQSVYGIPSEQVIGSRMQKQFKFEDGKTSIERLPKFEFNNDKDGKPVSIDAFIGKRPIAAFGNSDGDLAMLQYTMAGEGRRFAMFIHHTDAQREWAYDRESHIGKLDKGLDAAKKNGWTVVDMKKDWLQVFPKP